MPENPTDIFQFSEKFVYPVTMLGFFVWVWLQQYKDSRVREKKLIEKCDNQEKFLLGLTSNVTTVVERNNQILERYCAMMGSRPCLEDKK